MTGPEHYTRAEQLLRTLRDGYQEGSDTAAILTAAQVHATLALAAATAPAPTTVYRASYDSIVMGLYATEAPARKHCERLLSDEHPAGTSMVFAWIGDEDDPEEPRELVAEIDGGDEQPTGYVVTALEVASEYAPEADA